MCAVRCPPAEPAPPTTMYKPETDAQKDRQGQRQRQTQTNRQTDRQTGKQTDRQTDRQTVSQSERAIPPVKPILDALRPNSCARERTRPIARCASCSGAHLPPRRIKSEICTEIVVISYVYISKSQCRNGCQPSGKTKRSSLATVRAPLRQARELRAGGDTVLEHERGDTERVVCVDTHTRARTQAQREQSRSQLQMERHEGERAA